MPPWKKRFVYKSLLESETSTFPNTNNLIVIYLPEPVNRLKNQSAVWTMVFNTPIVFDRQKLFHAYTKVNHSDLACSK